MAVSWKKEIGLYGAPSMAHGSRLVLKSV